MGFLKCWLTSYFNPGRAFENLKDKPIYWGISGVLACWIGRSVLIILPLYLLGYEPLTESWLAFLPTEHYYLAEIFFLPVLGLLQWLTAGSFMYLLLRFVKGIRDFDTVLNYTGMAALIVFPAGLLLDWVTILSGGWNLMVLAITHSFLALYGIFLGSVALSRIFKLRLWLALGFTILVTPLEILWGAIFSR